MRGYDYCSASESSPLGPQRRQIPIVMDDEAELRLVRMLPRYPLYRRVVLQLPRPRPANEDQIALRRARRCENSAQEIPLGLADYAST